jgi:hypothetical protein
VDNGQVALSESNFDGFAKSRHSGAPRIGSGAGSEIPGIDKLLKRLQCGFLQRNDENSNFQAIYEIIKFISFLFRCYIMRHALWGLRF